MSAHRRLLADLIRLAETVLARPPHAVDLRGLDDDMTSPFLAGRIGVAERILFAALEAIVAGGAASAAELARLAFIAQQALASVRDRYFALVAAEAGRRGRFITGGGQ